MSTHHGPPCGHTVLGTCTGCGAEDAVLARIKNPWDEYCDEIARATEAPPAQDGVRDRLNLPPVPADTAHDDGCRCTECCKRKFDEWPEWATRKTDLIDMHTQNYNSEYMQNPAPLVAGETVEVSPPKSDPEREFTRGGSFPVGESGNIVIHNHYDPSTMLAAVDSRAGDKIVMNVIRGNYKNHLWAKSLSNEELLRLTGEPGSAGAQAKSALDARRALDDDLDYAEQARLEAKSKLSDREVAELVLMEHRRSGSRMECDCCHVRLHADWAMFTANFPGVSVGVKDCRHEPCKGFAQRVLRGADEMRAEAPVTGHTCAHCGADDLPADRAYLHSGMGVPGAPTTFVTCSDDECMNWSLAEQARLRAIADHASGNVTSDAELERLAKVPGSVGWTARAALERRHLESDTSGMPIGKAPTPVEARLMKATLDEIRRAPSQPFMLDSDLPTPRADGFDQRRIDEIKMSLLTASTKAVKK